MGCPALSRIVTILLILVFPLSTMLAETNNVAMLSASGAVAVNNSAIGTASANVYKGDSVTTSDGYAQIILRGTMISVRPNSQVTYQADGLNFGAGSAMVSTSTGMVARAAQVSIKPANFYKTRYELTVVGNSVTLHSSLGNLVLEFAGNTYNLAEGSTTTIGDEKDSGAPPTAAKAPPKRKKKPIAWLLLGAGAGAAAIGIAMASGGGNSNAAVSPSAP